MKYSGIIVISNLDKRVPINLWEVIKMAKKGSCRKTGKKAASVAGKVLGSKKSSKAAKKVAASALSQRAPKKTGPKKKK